MTSASNNYQQNTNSNGKAVISAALGVDYDYEVSAGGYVTQNGKVGVLNEAKTIEVTSREIRDKINQELPFEKKVINYKKNGKTYDCLIKGYPIKNKKGKLTHFIAFEKAL
jgi:hypothetical protein